MTMRQRVLDGDRLTARAGRSVQCYDSEATPCGCVVAEYCSIPAAPVEVERQRCAGERRCMVCGANWRVGPDMWTPLDVRKAAAA
jgi:hypothetical protein